MLPGGQVGSGGGVVTGNEAVFGTQTHDTASE
jgi:hypothetical protein